MKKSELKKFAKKVLTIEKQALTDLSNNIPEQFCDFIFYCRHIVGKLIITGVGKSGIIGRKIAATLSSTGSPSFFVHPAEATHGDLGMIENNDIVIAISISGESTELTSIIQYCNNNDICLVSITENHKSILANNSRYVLQIPKVEEACPLKLAPSSTALTTLALGDIIAFTLMKVKGFSSKDYKKYHPGGKLGAKLLTVSDIMYKYLDLPVVDAKASINTIALAICEKNLGFALVKLSTGHGIVTDGDLRRNLQNLSDMTAENICNSNPITVKHDMLISEAQEIMIQKRITVLPVLNTDSAIIGAVHLHDTSKK